jgi:hypothetical protein
MVTGTATLPAAWLERGTLAYPHPQAQALIRKLARGTPRRRAGLVIDQLIEQLCRHDASRRLIDFDIVEDTLDRLGGTDAVFNPDGWREGRVDRLPSPGHPGQIVLADGATVPFTRDAYGTKWQRRAPERGAAVTFRFRIGGEGREAHSMRPPEELAQEALDEGASAPRWAIPSTRSPP